MLLSYAADTPFAIPHAGSSIAILDRIHEVACASGAVRSLRNVGEEGMGVNSSSSSSLVKDFSAP